MQKAEKCDPFLRIIKDANEYRLVLKKTYTVVSASYSDGYIYVKVKRHSLISELKVGRFHLIKEVRVEDGLVVVTYDRSKVIVESATWTEILLASGGGYVVGVLTVIIIILL